MKTSIVILTYNQLHYTKLCIDSIRKYTDKNTYELIVIDNHSTDGTPQWLKEQEDIQCILNEKNLGFPKGCNQGIKMATGDNVLLLNNDVIVTPNWLTNLNKCLYSDEAIGAVGAVTNYCSYYQTIPTHYKNQTEMITFAQKNNISTPLKWEERLKLIGFCMLIKKEIVEKVGLLDERFSPGNFEDDDYSLRIKKAGYQLFLCKDAFIHHFGHTSFHTNNNKFNDLLSINRKKFQEKWGFDGWHKTNIHKHLIDFINDTPLKKINVLQIGCGCGGTLLQFKNIYKNATLYGIDSNKNALAIAGTFAHVHHLDIEKKALPYEEEFFDYILLGNILPLLYAPQKILKNLNVYLKDNGQIIASIPNIIHYGILKSLLTGNFPQKEDPFLNKIPIHFFTLEKIKHIFEDSNYIIEAISSLSLQETQEDKNFIQSLCHMVGKNMLQQYKASQYLVKAKKL
ncbi:MAG: glycosyltransferase [Marinisporobacter sp.]|jgi:GT2 family glycosyltransferase|nr:glycosyltransferase [Marinisporobacter sp.]